MYVTLDELYEAFLCFYLKKMFPYVLKRGTNMILPGHSVLIRQEVIRILDRRLSLDKDGVDCSMSLYLIVPATQLIKATVNMSDGTRQGKAGCWRKAHKEAFDLSVSAD